MVSCDSSLLGLAKEDSAERQGDSNGGNAFKDEARGQSNTQPEQLRSDEAAYVGLVLVSRPISLEAAVRVSLPGTNPREGEGRPRQAG